MVARRDRNLARSTVLLLALLLLFLACVLPVCAYNLYTLLSQTPSVHLNVAIYMIYWVQYGVNFCVYAAVNPKFRRAYRDLFLGSGMGSGGNSGGEGAGTGGTIRASGKAYKPSVTKLMLATPHLRVATSVALPVEEEEGEEEEEEEEKVVEESRKKHVIGECPLPLLLPMLLRLPKGKRSCKYLRSCSYHGTHTASLALPTAKERKIPTPVMSSTHIHSYSSAPFPHY
ncbi:hypothetical protein E2C01_022449 [Portunus trituberculatus]|uniref:G-protein coupled receptors family 1 profile domain-containing protein n=1 Tax=Portunus trituberculatus TaxID=210409 RepID=A0A5B7E7A8_PORTR|nr:hypothetical protein [Portunus trituberculatus]